VRSVAQGAWIYVDNNFGSQVLETIKQLYIKKLFIWSNTAKGEYLAETDRQKTSTVWAHMQNAQQQEDKGADVCKN